MGLNQPPLVHFYVKMHLCNHPKSQFGPERLHFLNDSARWTSTLFKLLFIFSYLHVSIRECLVQIKQELTMEGFTINSS